ncbi:hypothetical protein ACE6H2_016397 [Prunus campanulata]
MSDSESGFESEPNAFENESPNRERASDGDESGQDTDSDSGSEVEVVGERLRAAPTHGIGKGLMTSQPLPLAVVYTDGRQVGLGPRSEPREEEIRVPEASSSHRAEASTSGRGESSETAPMPRVTIVSSGNPRVPMGVAKEQRFDVDYLPPNKLTYRELAKIRAEYMIPHSVGMRIPGPTESLSNPKDGEVAFFTDVLQQGVRLPLQAPVQRILAQIGYAPGQFNPNFWAVLMGVVTAFGLAGEEGPSYEQFSHLYSITKSKSTDHGGWVQANCLRASERGHFLNAVPTSQKSWRNRRVLLSGDWESPSGVPVRFSIPTTFQIAGKLKQPTATQSELRQIDQVRLKVPAGDREYPQFLFTANLIKARLANPAEMTEERKKAEVKKMSETSKRRLGVIAKGKKQKRQPEASAKRVSEADLEEQPLSERQRQRTAESASRRVPIDEPLPSPGVAADAASSKASGKRPMTVDLDAASTPKRVRLTDPPRAIFAVEEEGGPTEAVTLACPSKTVQFANHMIVGSQMELSEIDDLPKRALREEARRAFRLQATASMDMWLCMKRAINAAERSKRMYEDGRSKVADAAKALQDHASLVQDMHAAERQIQAHEAKLAEMREALDGAERAAKDAEEAKLAVQAALEASERTKAAEVEAAVRGAIRDYRSSTEFTSLVDNEVASEMADLIYRFKRFNPGQKLNLNFAADPPPLPEGITEEMIEEYEGEDATEDGPDAEEGPDGAADADAEATAAEGGHTAEA